jgi:hypothetical protein
MFLLIKKLLICLSVELNPLIYCLSFMLNFVREVMFSRLLKEEQDLYQIVPSIPFVSTVTEGWQFMTIQIKLF